MAKKTYTAILSIHGIGRHQRHANAGALLTALEAVSGSTDNEYTHTIIEVQPSIEPPRVSKIQEDVPILKLRRARRYNGRLYPSGNFRIYEVNWSPDTRRRIALLPMLVWTARLVRSTVRSQPKNWLMWPRLRLARLRMAASGRQLEPRISHALSVLSSSYRKYRGTLGARHRTEKGAKPHFADFFNFTKGHANGAATSENLSAAAQIWHKARLPCESRLRRSGFFVVAGLVFSFVIISYFYIILSVQVNFEIKWQILGFALFGLFVFAAVFAGVRLLTTVFSDVRYWSALNQNDELNDTRTAVVDRTVSLIQHIVSDVNCVRVVIVSHSLGTAIAYDALRAIGLYNLARAECRDHWISAKKVDCLITLGSPIDKLAILFETNDSRSFREEIMREELRGDLTVMPFWVGDRQRIKWLNFWDPADPVSDPLYMPLGAKARGAKFEPTSIENIEVANTDLPDPARSHTTYLTNPAIAARIYNEIFRPEIPALGIEPNRSMTRRWFSRLIRISMASFILFLSILSIGYMVDSTRLLTFGTLGGGVALLLSLLGFAVFGTRRRLKRA